MGEVQRVHAQIQLRRSKVRSKEGTSMLHVTLEMVRRVRSSALTGFICSKDILQASVPKALLFSSSRDPQILKRVVSSDKNDRDRDDNSSYRQGGSFQLGGATRRISLRTLLTLTSYWKRAEKACLGNDSETGPIQCFVSCAGLSGAFVYNCLKPWMSLR